jgi:hypothetical protein
VQALIVGIEPYVEDNGPVKSPEYGFEILTGTPKNPMKSGQVAHKE